MADGRVGITGGSGVSWRWRGDGRREDHWRDTDVRLEGAIVEQLQAAFAENWREATGQLLGGAQWFPPSHEPRGRVLAHAVRTSPAAGDYGMYSLFLFVGLGRLWRLIRQDGRGWSRGATGSPGRPERWGFGGHVGAPK